MLVLTIRQSKEHKFRLIFRVALDIMPVQASAVPCERVFSSSKETDTLRRSNLDPILMEVLQVLKYFYRSDRLAFTEGLMANEEELMVVDLEPNVIQEMLMSGRVEELAALIDASMGKEPQ